MISCLLLGIALASTRLRECASAKPVSGRCLIFVLKDCPIANQYRPEIKRIADKYCPKGIAFEIVFEDPDLKLKDAQALARSSFSTVVTADVDKSGGMAKRYGATISPSATIVKAGKVYYRGRIDDMYPSIGKRRPSPVDHDLRDALDAFLAGKPIKHPVTQAVGCRLY